MLAFLMPADVSRNFMMPLSMTVIRAGGLSHPCRPRKVEHTKERSRDIPCSPASERRLLGPGTHSIGALVWLLVPKWERFRPLTGSHSRSKCDA
jgi:hypothetical protein